MKVSPLVWSALCQGLLLETPPAIRAEEDVKTVLEDFSKKVAEAEFQVKDGAPEQSQFPLQLKMIEGCIARGEFDRAREMLGSAASYGLPRELREEWTQLAGRVGEELDKIQAESMEKWRSAVEKLVLDTKSACPPAKASADLDPLLVRCAALQMRREQQNNILGERTTHKLMGVAATLTAWMNFLDSRDMGNTKRANEELRNLMKNDAIYPVLSPQEINAQLSADDFESLNFDEAVVRIFSGLKSPDDLPAIVEKLKTYAGNLEVTPVMTLANVELSRAEALKRAWDAVKGEDMEGALNGLEGMVGNGSYPQVERYYDPIKGELVARIVEWKNAKWTGVPRNPKEDASSYIDRILVELLGKADYGTMIEVMKFTEKYYRDFASGTFRLGAFSKDEEAIDAYLAAQHFESAGDILPAVTQYRRVVAINGSKYAPVAQAQDALKRLQEKNPDAFKSYEGALLEEMRNLREQVQMLLTRPQPGRPFP